MTEYHQAITVMPNGQVFDGEHDGWNGYPRSGLIASFKRDPKTRKISKTMMNSQLQALAAKVASGALQGATSIANKDNLSHLQMLRLYPEAQGVPDEYFYLDEMFTSRDVSQLEGREPFYDTAATAQYLDRLEESKATKTVYDEIKYDLKKLADKVYTPIEDLYRTIINPQTVDLSQLRWGFSWKRNQSALKALKDIGNTQSAIGSFALIANGATQSTNKPASELSQLFNAFLKANDVKITHVAMNPTLYTQYTENTWTRGLFQYQPVRPIGGGVIDLPGLPGITAVIDVAVPDNTIYAVNKPNALRLGEGPKIMRRYYDEEKDAEAIKVLDFHQYLSVDKNITKLSRKFGMTIPVSTNT